MENYPQEVLDKIGVLNTYTENKDLKEFDCVHMYPEELAFPNGYYDSRFFKLIGFNFDTHEKKDLGKHDGIDNFSKGMIIRNLRIFADGSTFVRFAYKVKVTGHFQSIEIE